MTERRRAKNEIVRLTKVDFTKREIFVEYSSGVKEEQRKQQFHIFVDVDEPIRDSAIEPIGKYTGIPLDEIHLFYRGMTKKFDYSNTWTYYGLQGGGFFHMARHDVPPSVEKAEKRGSGAGSIQRRPVQRRPSYSDVAKKAMRVPYAQSAPKPQDRVGAAQRRSSQLAAEKLEQQEADAAAEEGKQRLKQAEAERRAREAEESVAKQQRETEDAARRQREAEDAAKRQREAKEAAERQQKEEEARREQEAADAAKRQREVVDAARRQQEAADAAKRQREAREAEARARISIIVDDKFNNKRHTLRISLNDSLGQIKEQVAQQSGIPADKQQLFFAGKELTNANQAATDYGIKDGSLLTLEQKPIHIIVQIPNGQVLKLQVKPSDTTADIKSRVEKETGIKVPLQILKLEGQEIPNNQSLEMAGVQDGSTLMIEVPRILVTVNDKKNGTQIQLMVDPTDTVSAIKQQLEKESGIPVNKQKLTMRDQEFWNPSRSAVDSGIVPGSVLDLDEKPINITVRTPQGKILRLQVQPGEKTEDIKTRVEKETGMKVPKQILKSKGQEMPNGKSLESLGVRDGSELTVASQKMPVTVNVSNGDRLEIMVDPTDTVAQIKQQLEKETEIPVGKQMLSMSGREFSNNKQSAHDCGIKDGSILALAPKPINITVQTPSGKILRFQVNPSDNPSDIKARVEKEAGIKVPQQILKFQGLAMPNGKSLEAAGVKDESELVVDIHKVPITVNTSTGKKIRIMVDPTDTIEEIKQQLEKESGIPVDQQRLSKDEKEFSNNKESADKCGIKEGNILYLEPKPINITVRTPSGKILRFQVNPSDKSSDIKARVEKEAGIKVAQQILKFQGQEMPHNSTLEAAGVRDGSELTVDIYRVPVIVSTSTGNKIRIMVDPNDAISSIKQLLEKESGIPADQQRLSKDGKELSNLHQSAEDCGIRPGSILHLEPKAINISVRTPAGKVLKLQVQPGDTAAFIKAKVEKETGLKAPEQLLKFKEWKDMPNGKSMEAMGVQDGAVLDVEVLNKESKSPASSPSTLSTPTKKSAPTSSGPKQPPRPKVLQPEPENPVLTSDVFVALTMPRLRSNLSATDYSILAGKTQEFYTKHLQKKWGSVFQSVRVFTKGSQFRSGKPNESYNIYIEWDIRVGFDESPGKVVPDRIQLIRSLVEVDLDDYLMNYIISQSGTPFEHVRGMFTEQINSSL